MTLGNLFFIRFGGCTFQKPGVPGCSLGYRKYFIYLKLFAIYPVGVQPMVTWSTPATTGLFQFPDEY
jgi:hypothetical protein